MPETAIGFIPDIGSTYFLPRLPAGVGLWLGLTGARVRGADAVAVGLATHFVPSDLFEDLADDIRPGPGLSQALSRYDERRVGKECVRPCSSRGTPVPKKK